MTRADADADKEHFDRSGNDQVVCVKEAKAAEIAIRADAEAQLKIWEANQTARDEGVATDAKAKEEGAAARNDAAAKMRDANYAVAKAKCDTLASADSDRCVQEAKKKYGM